MGNQSIKMQPWRLLNRDGTFNVSRVGQKKVRFNDLYHSLLSVSWPAFLALFTATYFTLNLFFALGYFLCGSSALGGADSSSIARHLMNCFFFSVQTFATIGYGKITPEGLPANILVTFEALTGLFSMALATGLLFARFARPTARVVFSNKALITNHDGVPSFLFRIANERRNQVVDAQLTVVLSISEKTAEGDSYRTFYDMKLERDRSPIFALSWTVVHPIDKNSPLARLDKQKLTDAEAEFIVSFVGIDDTFSQTIHSRFSYTPEDIIWGKTFSDMLRRNEAGKMVVDISKIHHVQEQGQA